MILFSYYTSGNNNIFFQPFNKAFVEKSPFTMTGVYEVPAILLEGDFAVKIDLENGKILILYGTFKIAGAFSLLPCSNTRRALEVPDFCLEWPCLPIQSALFWDEKRPFCFSQPWESSEGLFESKGR